MSVEAITWAFAQDALTPGDKFLLVALANIVNEAGIGFPGRERLAELTGWDKATVSRHLRTLEGKRLIARTERRRANGSRTSDWTVLAPNRAEGERAPMRFPLRDDDHPPEVMALLAVEGGDSSGDDLQGDDLPPGQVALSGSPEPSEEPSVEPSATDRTREAVVSDDLERDAVELLRAKRKVDGRVVSGREMEIAKAALAEFNRQSGKRLALGPQRHLSLLVGRARDHPTWGPGSYVRAVQAAFRDPWWERPGAGGHGLKLGHVFGEGAFERIVEEARDGRDGSPRKRFVRPGHDHRVNEHA